RAAGDRAGLGPAVAVPCLDLRLARDMDGEDRLGERGQRVAADELAPAAERPAVAERSHLDVGRAAEDVADDLLVIPYVVPWHCHPSGHQPDVEPLEAVDEVRPHADRLSHDLDTPNMTRHLGKGESQLH